MHIAVYVREHCLFLSCYTPRNITKRDHCGKFLCWQGIRRYSKESDLRFYSTERLGNVITVTFAQSRVNQELAQEGVLPFGRFWASNLPKGAPGAGLLLHFIPSFIVIIAIPAGDAFNFILDVEGYPASILNLFVVLGLFILRYASPNAHRPFETWIIVPVFFLIAQGFLLTAPFLRPPGGKGDTSLPN